VDRLRKQTVNMTSRTKSRGSSDSSHNSAEEVPTGRRSSAATRFGADIC